MAEENTKPNKIASHCDARCQYATNQDGSCDCECGGANHGQGSDPAIREKQATRHLKTKRGFKENYNQLHGNRAAQRLYRSNREEFNKLYLAYIGEATVKEAVPGATPAREMEIIKQSSDGEYQHVRYPNKKTAYLHDGKVITKADVPAELGW